MDQSLRNADFPGKERQDGNWAQLAARTRGLRENQGWDGRPEKRGGLVPGAGICRREPPTPVPPSSQTLPGLPVADCRGVPCAQGSAIPGQGPCHSTPDAGRMGRASVLCTPRGTSARLDSTESRLPGPSSG